MNHSKVCNSVFIVWVSLLSTTWMEGTYDTPYKNLYIFATTAKTPSDLVQYLQRKQHFCKVCHFVKNACHKSLPSKFCRNIYYDPFKRSVEFSVHCVSLPSGQHVDEGTYDTPYKKSLYLCDYCKNPIWFGSVFTKKTAFCKVCHFVKNACHKSPTIQVL